MALRGEKLRYESGYLNWLKSDFQTCPRERILMSLDGYAEPIKHFAETKFFAGVTDIATFTRSLCQYHTNLAG